MGRKPKLHVLEIVVIVRTAQIRHVTKHVTSAVLAHVLMFFVPCAILAQLKIDLVTSLIYLMSLRVAGKIYNL